MTDATPVGEQLRYVATVVDAVEAELDLDVGTAEPLGVEDDTVIASVELRIPTVEGTDSSKTMPPLEEFEDAEVDADEIVEELEEMQTDRDDDLPEVTEQGKPFHGPDDEHSEIDDEQSADGVDIDDADDPVEECDQQETTDEIVDELTEIPYVGGAKAIALREAGYESFDELGAADRAELTAIEEIGGSVADRVLAYADERGGRSEVNEDDEQDSADELTTDDVLAELVHLSEQTEWTTAREIGDRLDETGQRVGQHLRDLYEDGRVEKRSKEYPIDWRLVEHERDADEHEVGDELPDEIEDDQDEMVDAEPEPADSGVRELPDINVPLPDDLSARTVERAVHESETLEGVAQEIDGLTRAKARALVVTMGLLDKLERPEGKIGGLPE